MRLRRPRSLNGLILVGFGLVALPLLVAVIWALFNLDRLAEQSEQIINMGVASAERNRLLAEDVVQLQRSTNQYYVLRNDESRTIMLQDLRRIEQRPSAMGMLTNQANVTDKAVAIGNEARDIVAVVSKPEVSAVDAEAAIERFEFGLRRIERDFRHVFRTPEFTIPGDTTLKRFESVVEAILGLNKGQKRALFRALGGGGRSDSGSDSDDSDR